MFVHCNLRLPYAESVLTVNTLDSNVSHKGENLSHVSWLKMN